MSDYSSMDRYHKNGCQRFIEYWKMVNKDNTYLTITDKGYKHTYELMYVNDEDSEVKEYVRLRKYYGEVHGDSMYFPVLSEECDIDVLLIEVVFDDTCTDLFDLFKLLNNKKNFNICDGF